MIGELLFSNFFQNLIHLANSQPRQFPDFFCRHGIERKKFLRENFFNRKVRGERKGYEENFVPSLKLCPKLYVLLLLAVYLKRLCSRRRPYKTPIPRALNVPRGRIHRRKSYVAFSHTVFLIDLSSRKQPPRSTARA